MVRTLTRLFSSLAALWYRARLRWTRRNDLFIGEQWLRERERLTERSSRWVNR